MGGKRCETNPVQTVYKYKNNIAEVSVLFASILKKSDENLVEFHPYNQLLKSRFHSGLIMTLAAMPLAPSA
jgi:hypothetical protein